jgi:hypothetical protein
MIELTLLPFDLPILEASVVWGSISQIENEYFRPAACRPAEECSPRTREHSRSLN